MYPFVHIIGLSATIGNPERFAEWVDAELIQADASERPIPLEWKVIEFPNTWNAGEKYAIKVGIVGDIIRQSPDSKAVIFCTSRSRTVNVARDFNKGKPKRYGDPMDVVKSFASGGTVYHNAGFKRKTLNFVEETFRENPDVNIMGATTTVSEGINLPFDDAYVFDTCFWNWLTSEEVLIPQNKLIQMIGRAGRPGMSKTGVGRAFIISEQKYASTVRKMLERPVMVKSQISKELKSEMIRFIVSFAETKEMLYDAFSLSIDPLPEDTITEALDWLITNGFIREEGDQGIVPTHLGLETARTFIRPETALDILEVNKKFSKIKMEDDEDYISLYKNLMDTQEFWENVVVRNTRSDKNAVELAQLVGEFPREGIAKAFAMAFKKHFIIKELVKPEQLERPNRNNSHLRNYNFGLTAGDKYTLEKLSSRIVYASSRICFGNAKIYNNLKAMIYAGYLDVEMIKLRQISNIGDTRLNKLMKVGITTIGKFFTSQTGFLSKILGLKPATIDKMKKEAKLLY
jgi:replicative superfamily II helicase